MKINNWDDPTLPIEVVALKLCEEVGEVAKEIAYAANPVYKKYLNTHAVLMELVHVEQIATVLRMRIEHGAY